MKPYPAARTSSNVFQSGYPHKLSSGIRWGFYQGPIAVQEGTRTLSHNLLACWLLLAVLCFASFACLLPQQPHQGKSQKKEKKGSSKSSRSSSLSSSSSGSFGSRQKPAAVRSQQQDATGRTQQQAEPSSRKNLTIARTVLPKRQFKTRTQHLLLTSV